MKNHGECDRKVIYRYYHTEGKPIEFDDSVYLSDYHTGSEFIKEVEDDLGLTEIFENSFQ